MVFQSIYAVIGIPVIFVLGFSGSLIPPLLAYLFPAYNITKKYWFTFFNGIAAGVVLAVGFVHSLNDSQLGFTADVYDYSEYNLTDNYAWADWICMVAIIGLFTVEEIMAIIANRCGLRGLDPHYNGVEQVEEEDDSHELHGTNNGHPQKDGHCDALPLDEPCDTCHPDNDGKDKDQAGSCSSCEDED